MINLSGVYWEASQYKPTKEHQQEITIHRLIMHALINGTPHPSFLGLGGGEVGDCHVYDVVTPHL